MSISISCNQQSLSLSVVQLELSQHRKKEKRSNMSKLPGFCNVFTSSSSKELPIPLAFSSIVGTMPDMVVLKNSNEMLWPVEVTKQGGHLFFTRGWEKFVEDNSVETADILVFDYDGHNVIRVRLMGRTRIKKMGFTSSDFKVKEKPKGDEDDEEEGKIIVIEDEDDDDEEEAEDSDYMETEETDETDEDEDSQDEEKLGEETLGNAKKRGKKEPSSSSKGFKSPNFKTSRAGKGKAFLTPEGECTDKEEEEVLKENPAKRGGHKRKPDMGNKDRSGKKPKVEEEEDDIFKYEVVPWPKNPFFVGKIQEKRRSQLFIPLDVIRDHKLQLPSKIDLIDEEGMKWEGSVLNWTDGRSVIVKGWKPFCKWNRVNPADRCICEFIQEKGPQNGIFLKMQILRKGSWLPKH